MRDSRSHPVHARRATSPVSVFVTHARSFGGCLLGLPGPGGLPGRGGGSLGGGGLLGRLLELEGLDGREAEGDHQGEAVEEGKRHVHGGNADGRLAGGGERVLGVGAEGQEDGAPDGEGALADALGLHLGEHGVQEAEDRVADADDRDAVHGDGGAALGAGHLSDGAGGVGEVLRWKEGGKDGEVSH